MKILFLIHFFLEENNPHKHGVAILANEIANQIQPHETVIVDRKFAAKYEVIRNDYKGIKRYTITSPANITTLPGSRYIEDDKICCMLGRIIQSEQGFEIANIHHMSRWPSNTANYIKSLGIPVVLTIHDTWHICPVSSYFNKNNNCVCSPELRTSSCSICIRSQYIEKFKSDINIDELYQEYDKTITSCIQLFNEANAVIYPSKKCHDYYVNENIIHPRTHIIPSFIPAPEVKKQPHKGFVVGSLSNIALGKGIESLISAFSLIPYDDIKLKIFGYSFDFNEPAIKDNRIEYCGPYKFEDIGKILSQLDIVVVPSVFPESFNLCSYLSVSSGVKLVVSDIAYHKEFLEDNSNCLVFKASNINDLADKIVLAYKNRTPICPLTTDQQTVGNKYLSVYESVIANKNQNLDCSMICYIKNALDIENLQSLYLNFNEITIYNYTDKNSLRILKHHMNLRTQKLHIKNTEFTIEDLVKTISNSPSDVILKYGYNMITTSSLRKSYKSDFATNDIILAHVDNNGIIVDKPTGIMFIKNNTPPEYIRKKLAESILLHF